MIEAVGRGNWITASEMSFLLKVSTAMAAEVAGACILTEVLDLMFGQRINVEMVTQCIESVTDKMMKDKTTAPQKARSHKSYSTTPKKCLIAFGEINSSQSETALCSALLVQSGTDVMVPLVRWPLPGHQRMDSPSESAGCLAARKKKEKSPQEQLRVAY